MRVLGVERIELRGLRQANRIVGCLGALAKTIKDNQHYRARVSSRRHAGHSSSKWVGGAYC
jgi:hypothetical protein